MLTWTEILEKLFYNFNNLHQKIMFIMEEESNKELAFVDTFLKSINANISVLVYR